MRVAEVRSCVLSVLVLVVVVVIADCNTNNDISLLCFLLQKIAGFAHGIACFAAIFLLICGVFERKFAFCEHFYFGGRNFQQNGGVPLNH